MPLFYRTAGLLAAALLLTVGSGPSFENLTAVRIVAVPAMDLPAYLEPTTDPAFGSRIVRITDPGSEILPGVRCAPTHCRHRYSSSQGWNADQSLLAISKGCPGICFLHGRHYRPLFQRRPGGSCVWHPSDSARMICVSGTEIYEWEVQGDTRRILYAPAEYGAIEFGPGKNNLSRDGSRLVVRAVDRSGALVAFAYDVATGTKFPDIQLDDLVGSNSYCSISPSGRYVFCFQRTPENGNVGYVFTTTGEMTQYWDEDHRPGHGDMAIDEDGSDVYVGISKAEPDKYQVIKRRLSDGAVTALTGRGLAQHASVRNIDRPGWVFLTYGGTYSRASRPGIVPLHQEIVALRIDGSGELRRIAHTRSAEHDYLSEAHASPSPDGSQVVWASNWGQPGAFVAAYVARISWPEEDATRPAVRTRVIPGN